MENAKVPVSQRRLKPILPILFYTGSRRWNRPVTLNAVMDLPELMDPFVPKFETLFLPVKDTDTDEFLQHNHPFAWLMTVLQKVEEDDTSIDEILEETLEKLDTLSPEETALHTHAIVYLSHLVVCRRPEDEREHLMQRIMIHNKDTEVERLIMTGAEALIEQGKRQGLKQGKAQGLEQGLEQGLQQGEIQTKREVLLTLLGHRIGDIPDTITKKVSRIRSRTRLDSLLEQAATAEKLDDIKWD